MKKSSRRKSFTVSQVTGDSVSVCLFLCLCICSFYSYIYFNLRVMKTQISF